MTRPHSAAPSRGAGTSRLQSVTIAGPAGALEGLLQEHEGQAPEIVAIVCHPHPLYGGTMHNKVVHRVASVMHDLGAAVLRFNFRGAGKSEGRHDAGAGELDDGRAALAWLRARHPHTRCWIAGFSFGSWITARLGAHDRSIERMILIAPPVRRSHFSVLADSPVPKLVIQGTRDDVCPLEALWPVYSGWSEPKELRLIEGATHFFDRQLGDLAEVLVEVLAGPAPGATSSST